MTEKEVREEFYRVIFSYLHELSFVIKQKSKGEGARGYILFEKVTENSIKYLVQLTFTSYLAVGPYFNATYQEIDEIIKKLDKSFAKNQGTSTFNSCFFEFINPANSDGYLNESAGNPYFQIKAPYSLASIEKQGTFLAETIIIPALKDILLKTDSLKKSDEILNEKNPIRPDKNRLLTTVLCNPIPLHMMMSLLTAHIYKRDNLNDLIIQYRKYVSEEYETNNSFVFMLEKVINSLEPASGPEVSEW